jgi:flagellar biogenesis protein FliO
MHAPLAALVLDASTSPLAAAQGPDLTRYFTVLGILLAAIVGLAFGFKKLFAGALRAKAARRHLAVVDLLPLGGKQRLAVVRCYDRTFALGLGDKEVALIAELDAVHAEHRGLRAPDAAERAEFARVLAGAGRAESARERVAPQPAAASAPGTPTSSTSAPSIGRRLRELLGTRGVLG